MSKYHFNEYYFDTIDNSHKAYWLGFIWADGCISYRRRVNRGDEYCLKIALQDVDCVHLQKFVDDIDGDMDIKFYQTTGYSNHLEARVCIYQPYMPKMLRTKYGIVSHRTNCDKIMSQVSKEYIRDFIRGIFDADGTFSIYQCQCKDGYVHNKSHLTFGGQNKLLRYIENTLMANGVVENCSRQTFKRHPNRDGEWEQIRFSGNIQTYKILHWLYDDADIYLDRKYNKFLKHIQKEGDNNAV